MHVAVTRAEERLILSGAVELEKGWPSRGARRGAAVVDGAGAAAGPRRPVVRDARDRARVDRGRPSRPPARGAERAADARPRPAPRPRRAGRAAHARARRRRGGPASSRPRGRRPPPRSLPDAPPRRRADAASRRAPPPPRRRSATRRSPATRRARTASTSSATSACPSASRRRTCATRWRRRTGSTRACAARSSTSCSSGLEHGAPRARRGRGPRARRRRTRSSCRDEDVADLLGDGRARSPRASSARGSAAAAGVHREHWFAFPLMADGPLVNGVVDVLAEEADGTALVVDYKSDRVGDADLEALVEASYGVQRRIYGARVPARGRARGRGRPHLPRARGRAGRPPLRGGRRRGARARAARRARPGCSRASSPSRPSRTARCAPPAPAAAASARTRRSYGPAGARTPCGAQ